MSEQRILQSTIGVITNAREDHLDEMGPTREDEASVLALLIPKSGCLVVGEEEFFRIKRKNCTSAVFAENNAVSDADLDLFPYIMF